MRPKVPHNPLKQIDFTFRNLSWGRRLRCNLNTSALREKFPDWTAAGMRSIHTAVDLDLDQLIWLHGGGKQLFGEVRKLQDRYIESNGRDGAVKAALLSNALDDTFAGHHGPLNLLPMWITYAARVSKVTGGSEMVLFIAESDEMAIDLVLNEMLRMKDLEDSQPNHVWSLDRLYYKPGGIGYFQSGNSCDIDLTEAFWERVGSLFPRRAVKKGNLTNV